MKFILIFFGFLSAIKVASQPADNTFRRNEYNIYYQALSHYLDFRSTDSFFERDKRIDTLFVYNDTKTGDSLMSTIKSTEIIMIVDPFDYIVDRKLKGISLYSLFPLRYDGREFSVTIVPFGVTANKKKRRLNFSRSDTYKVFFKFFEGRFYFDRVEQSGI